MPEDVAPSSTADESAAPHVSDTAAVTLEPSTAASGSHDEGAEVDDLASIEFLLDEIEDQIAPLAL